MKKVILIIVVAILIGVGGYLLFNRFQKKPPVPKTEAPSVEIVKLEKSTVVFKQDTNFAVDKPVVGGGYSIIYEGPFKTYTVDIQAKSIEDYRKIKATVENEFKAKGVKDLCTLKIMFIMPKEITSHANQTDIFASGCKSFL